MDDVGIEVVESTSLEGCRYCLIGFPDVGLVSTIALSYLIGEKELNEFGYLESDQLPPMVVIHEGDPKPLMRLYEREGVVGIISEIPLDYNLITPMAKSIVDWAERRDVEAVIAMSGIAVQNRLDIDAPNTYGIGSSTRVKNLIKERGIQVFEEGFVTGLHAAILREGVKRDVPCIILLTQSHLRYPDPGAAASMVESLNKITGWNVDTNALLEQEEEIRLRMRELMQNTQQEMQMIQKAKEQEIPPMVI